MSTQPEAALELLDDAVMTNGKLFESEELLVILDYKHYLNEGLNTSEKENCNPKPLDERLSEDNSTGSNNTCDEMAIHKMMLKTGLRKMMTHPVLDSFLHLKWQLTKKIYFIHIFLYCVFILSFTSLTVFETVWQRCNETTISTTINETPNDTNCECKIKCPFATEFQKENNHLDDSDWKPF